MKKTLSILLLLVSIVSFAQITPPVQKSISVTGTAEMEIVPDEIYFRVVLKEYLKDKTKVPLEKLEKELSQAVLASGVKQEDFMVEQVYGQRWTQKKYKDAELYNAKSYIIKVSDPAKIDEILDKINPESIESVNIRNYSHSRLEEYKKQLKIEAIKAAKVKATYLLEAIGEQPGGVLTVNETEYSTYGGFYMDEREIANNEYHQFEKSMASAVGVGFKTITLQFQVQATFAIK